MAELSARRFSLPCIPGCIGRAPRDGCFGAAPGGLVLARAEPPQSHHPDPGLGGGTAAPVAQQGEATVPVSLRRGLTAAWQSTVHWGEPPCQTKRSWRCWSACRPRWRPRASAMSAPVPEPPALVRSPEAGQRGSCKPGHILAQLSAALENPDVKALEVKGDAALDVGVAMSTGFVPGCHEHGTCPGASLVREHGIPMCAKIWGGGRNGKSSFLQRVDVPGAGSAPQKQKACYSQVFLKLRVNDPKQLFACF